MKKHFVSIWSKIKSSLPLQLVLMVAGLIFLDALILHLGFYDKQLPIDIPQHIFGGMCFAFIPFQIIRYYRSNISVFTSMYLIFSTAVFASFLWELIEYLSQKLVPDFSNRYYLYSNTPSDLLSDMASGMLGGILAALLFYFLDKKNL